MFSHYRRSATEPFTKSVFGMRVIYGQPTLYSADWWEHVGNRKQDEHGPNETQAWDAHRKV